MKAEKHQEEFTKFKELVEKINTGILITINEKGELKGRPMATTDVDEDGSLWFFTNEFSGKVGEISHNNEVFITYAGNDDNQYVVVTGNAFVFDDKAKMKELWNPIVKIWFPDGLEDPRLTLLKVEPTEVEYWTDTSSKIVILFKMLSSILKRESYKDAEHGKIEVKS
jgi:general stress protein 26